jgi:putative nucleotidyltransferase with HDIG domain
MGALPTVLAPIEAGTDRARLFEDVRCGRARAVSQHRDRPSWRELDALACTPQDPGWHAEGDVLTHTDMVLAACEQSERALEREEERALVRLACLLHDIAKPYTTRWDPEVGRVIARGHERMGGVHVRQALHGSGLSGAARRTLAELVATHHLVKRSVQRADEEGAVAALERLAARVDTRLLWALEDADMRGRVCEDQASQLEVVALFRMLCEERGLFGVPPTPWLDDDDVRQIRWASDEARRYALAEVHRRRLVGAVSDAWHARGLAHELARGEPPQVIITVGVSGSGKTTALRELGRDWVLISPDEWRQERYGDASEQGDPAVVHRACRERLKEVLRAKGRAAYDGTNVVADHRASLLELCHAYGAHVTLWVFDVSPTVAMARNRARDRRVPDAVIARQCVRFEWPGPEEAHALRVIEA